MNTWNKIEELMEFVKTHDIKELKDYWNHREEKRNNTLLWVLAIIGAVAAVYRYMTPDYLEDFEDDFDDDFEDDFFEDEEDEEEKIQVSNAATEDDFAE